MELAVSVLLLAMNVEYTNALPDGFNFDTNA
jgi:hypothetical protein